MKKLKELPKIKLFNRDGANLYLVKTNEQIESNIFKWEFEVDFKHKYILEYCRFIMNDNIIESIDPSGGPFISLGDEFENKYKIIKINSANNIWISERDNNN